MKNPATKAYKGRAIGLACVLLFIACGPRASDTFVSAPDKGVSVEDISAKPDDHIGKQVTVVAPIRRTFGEKVFLLFAENRPDDLLVVGADPYPDQQNESIDTSLIQAKGVRVTGVVRSFDPAAIERETGGIKLDDERLRPYIGKPVIVAKSIQ